MRAAVALLVMVACSRQEPSSPPRSTPSQVPDPPATPAPGCADISLSPASHAARVSFTPHPVTGTNLTSSYKMSFVAVAGGKRWAGSAYDGAALWEGTERLRHIPCVTRACLPHEPAFADGGKTLLVGLSRFDVASGQGTAIDPSDALSASGMNEIESVAWTPDGALVLAAVQHRPSACCRDRATPARIPPARLLALDGRTGALVKDLGERSIGRAMAAGASQIVASMRDGLTVWDRATFTSTTRADVQATRLYLHPRGSLLASVDEGEVTLWRMPDFCPTGRFAADTAFVHALAFHPTAPVLFTAGTDRTLRAFSTTTPGLTLGTFEVADARTDMNQLSGALAVTADGRLLVVPLYMDERVLALEITLSP